MFDNEQQSGGDTVSLLRVVGAGRTSALARSAEMGHHFGEEGIFSIVSENLYVMEQPEELE